MGGGGDDHAEVDDDTTSKHTLSSTVSIRDDSGKGSTDHGSTISVRYDPKIMGAGTDLDSHSVEGENEGYLTTGSACLECVLEVWHGKNGSHERSIVSIGTSATKCNEDGDLSDQHGILQV